MVNRRAIVSGLLGGFVGGTASRPSSAEAITGDSCDLGPVVSAIDRLRDDEMRKQRVFWELEPIRQHQRNFLRAFNKYPDFLEVGADIWHDVCDWHIRYDQAMTLGGDSHAAHDDHGDVDHS